MLSLSFKVNAHQLIQTTQAGMLSLSSGWQRTCVQSHLDAPAPPGWAVVPLPATVRALDTC